VPVTPWVRIKEHKIIQWGVGYLAAALALTHAEELIARAFDWPEFVSRALIVVLALGLPVAITLAWYHGHRASRHVSGAEASILAVLLLIGAGFLWVFVRPHEPAVTQSAAREAAPTTPPVSSTAAVTASSTASQPVAPPASGKPRIAILPFENLSPDPKDAFFTDGLHEEIISTLSSRAPDLEVISRTTMMTYRTSNKPAPQIARELGATHVLEGSVRRAGKRVRLTLQLIAASTDDHLWAQNYDRTLTDALTLQSDVANQVASQLSVQLASRASTFKPLTRDPQAYDLFLKARLEDANSIRGISTPLEALQKVESLLSDALARDPDFARAYAQRARVRLLQFADNYDTPQHAMPLVQKDLAAAERLAPDDPEVLFAKATYHSLFERDPAGAVAVLEAARADGLDPVLQAVSATILQFAGRYEEAVQRTQHAMAISPKDRAAFAPVMRALLYVRRPGEALRVADLDSVEFPETSLWRDYIVWAHTGVGSPTAVPLESPVADITANVDIRSVSAFLFPLRLQGRYREMIDYLARAKASTVRGQTTLGLHPVAELRGWAHLLLGDRAAAAQDGREVLDFVAHTDETKWNQAVLSLLTAEGNTFAGDKPRAVTAAGKALRLSGWFEEAFVPPRAALVYAWSGDADDAAALLEKLSTQVPMVLDLPSATIARDPLYTVPLAGNARYKALQTKLEAQMAATKLE
jgi:TolB-like protein